MIGPAVNDIDAKLEEPDPGSSRFGLTQTEQRASSLLAEAQTQRATIDKEWRADILAQLAEAHRVLNRVRISRLQEKARVRQLTVRAPVAGIVQDIKVTTRGQATGANEPLMSIVPMGEQLIIEAHVANDEIGYIATGQEATVKIRTYDFVRFGTLTGRVVRIAPDAHEDRETGRLRFNVMVRIDLGGDAPDLVL